MRYIDADELKKRLRRSLVAENVYEMGVNAGLWRATKEIDSLPDADVVPKSEVINGVLTTDKLTLEDVIEHYQKAYARDIFEEIRALTEPSAIYGKVNIDIDKLAELEKKCVTDKL